MLVFTVAVAVAGSLAVSLAAAGPLSATELSRSEDRRTLVFFFLKIEA